MDDEKQRMLMRNNFYEPGCIADIDLCWVVCYITPLVRHLYCRK